MTHTHGYKLFIIYSIILAIYFCLYGFKIHNILYTKISTYLIKIYCESIYIFVRYMFFIINRNLNILSLIYSGHIP